MPQNEFGHDNDKLHAYAEKELRESEEIQRFQRDIERLESELSNFKARNPDLYKVALQETKEKYGRQMDEDHPLETEKEILEDIANNCEKILEQKHKPPQPPQAGGSARPAADGHAPNSGFSSSAAKPGRK